MNSPRRKENVWLKVGILLAASIAAAIINRVVNDHAPLNAMVIAAGTAFFFIPAFILGFIYRGPAGLIPGLGAVIILSLLLHSNATQNREEVTVHGSVSQWD